MSQHQVEGVRGMPQGLPMLGHGKHANPQQGACVMEYTSLLAGERFSYQPRCTHPALAEFARQVNDRLSQSARVELVTRAPALAAIGPRVPGVAAAVSTAACEFALREVLGPWPRTGLRRRLAGLQVRDRPGRGGTGQRWDTVTAYFLISTGLNATARSQPDRPATGCCYAPSTRPWPRSVANPRERLRTSAPRPGIDHPSSDPASPRIGGGSASRSTRASGRARRGGPGSGRPRAPVGRSKGDADQRWRPARPSRHR